MFSILGLDQTCRETRNTKGDNFLVLFIGERYLENFKNKEILKRRMGDWWIEVGD